LSAIVVSGESASAADIENVSACLVTRTDFTSLRVVRLDDEPQELAFLIEWASGDASSDNSIKDLLEANHLQIQSETLGKIVHATKPTPSWWRLV
jgi:hypothetical protein